MLVYFSVLFFIVLLCLFIPQKSDGKKALFVCCSSIFLMSFLQNGWGGDGWNYYFVFETLHGLSINDVFEDTSHGELGFKLMYAFMPSIGYCKLIGYGLFAVALYFFVYEFVPKKWWAFFFIMLFIDRSMLMGEIATFPRNGIAIAAFLIALHYLRQGKKLVYLVILFAASYFHTSSLIFTPLVFLPPSGFKLKSNVGLILSVLLIIVSFVFPNSLNKLSNLFIDNFETFEEYSAYSKKAIGRGLFSFLILCPLFWIYELTTHSHSSICSEKDRFIISLAIIQILFDFLPAIGLKARFFFYLDYGLMAGLLTVLEKEKFTTNRWIIVLSLLFVYGKRFYEFVVFSPMLEKWTDYNFIFAQ